MARETDLTLAMITHESAVIPRHQMWKIFWHRYTAWYFGMIAFPSALVFFDVTQRYPVWSIPLDVAVHLSFVLVSALITWVQTGIFKQGGKPYASISASIILAALLFEAPKFFINVDRVGWTYASVESLPRVTVFILISEMVALFFIMVVVPVIMSDLAVKPGIRPAERVLKHSGVSPLNAKFGNDREIDSGNASQVQADPPDDRADGADGTEPLHPKGRADQIMTVENPPCSEPLDEIKWEGHTFSPDAICVITASGNYVHIATRDRSEFLLGPMYRLVEQIPEGLGMLVNRSCWVARANVAGQETVRGHLMLTLDVGEPVRVGRKLREDVKKFLEE